MPIKRSKRLKKTNVPGVWSDGPDRFLVRVNWTDPKTGRMRERRTVATTFPEAVALRESLRSETDTRKRTRLRFSDFAEQWLAERAERLSPSTRQRYAGELAHLIVGFGEFAVGMIEPGDIRRWQTKASRKVAPATINGWLRTLRVVLEDAVTDGWLARNPARAVKALPEGRTKGRRGNALDVGEFRKAITTISDLMMVKVERKPRETRLSPDVGRLLLTIAWTGMRRGELLALEWTDEVEGELRIERSVWGKQVKSTKTDDPRRVTITEPLREVLAEQRAWLLRTQHPGLASGLVFPARRATVLESGDAVWFRTASVLDKPLAAVVAVAGVRPISVHSFRRTYENLLRRAGVDDLVRRSIAGWRTNEAQAIYATVDRSERDRAALAVTEFVMGKAGPEAGPGSEKGNARQE